MTQHVIGYANQRVFLAKHGSVLTNKSQTVDIGIDNNTQVIITRAHLIHNATQILLQRLWVVGKIARRLTIQYLIGNPQTVEQLGQYDTTNTIDGIYTHLEMCIVNSFLINQVERKNVVHMPVVSLITVEIMSQLINIGILKIFILSNLQDFGSIGSC